MAKFAVRDEGILVRGFTEVQRALKRLDAELAGEVRDKLKLIGERVKEVAAGNVSHKTGRHGNPGPRIEDSIKVGATLKQASVYSTSVAAGVQNSGGTVGYGAVVRREDVSQFMTRAVQSTEGYIEQETQAVIDWLLAEFERD